MYQAELITELIKLSIIFYINSYVSFIKYRSKLISSNVILYHILTINKWTILKQHNYIQKF